jgi:hypothetical protein
MAETPEATEEAVKAPETTPVSEWVIPNQAKFEQVIDARLAKHADNEKADKKTSSRSRSATPAAPAAGDKDKDKAPAS